MIIYLVRHGEYKRDKLTMFGRKQIKILYKTLKHISFDICFCSPIKRCVQSAKILCKNKIAILTDARLTERQQLSHKPTSNEELNWWENYLNLEYRSSKNLPEDCSCFFDRIYNFLNFIKSRYNNANNILIVAHSSAVYAFLSYFYKIKSKEIIWNGLELASCLKFEI